jgi:hypothetical protein
VNFLNQLVKMEWAAAALAAILLYPLTGQSWWLFLVLALGPDLAMVGYLAGPRVGAFAYNLAHVTLWPSLLAVAGLLLPNPLLVAIALIWLCHIAVDRALGYGLKLTSDFRDTHLGRVGKG